MLASRRGGARPPCFASVEPAPRLRPVRPDDRPAMEALFATLGSAGAHQWFGFLDPARAGRLADGTIDEDGGQLAVVAGGDDAVVVGRVQWFAVDSGPGQLSRCW